MTPSWLQNEILDGLSKLVCLRLDNGPAEDMITGTAAAWGVAFSVGKFWDEGRDRWRVQEGFNRLLASGLSRWPQPGKLMELLPEPKVVALPAGRDPQDPYEIAHRRRMAEYEAAGQ